MFPSPKVFHHDDDLFIGSWCDVTIIIWKGQTTVEGARLCGAGVDATVEAHGGRGAMLTVVPPKVPMPPRDALSALGEALSSKSGTLLASAVVHPGDGFRSAAVRLVVRGLGLLVETDFPHRIFSSLDAASGWLAENGACEAMSAHGLARVVQDLEVDVLGRRRGR